MERAVRTVKLRKQYAHSRHKQAAVHPVRLAVTVQYIIFKATKKPRHMDSPF